MAAVTPKRTTIGEEALREAREADQADLRNSALVLRRADGTEHVLPSHLQGVLLDTLKALADTGEVFIGNMPRELTTTVAAETLGVSRPTLMKWVKEGAIDSYKVGSHARFRREDVLALKEQQAKARQDAFSELRALDAELDETLDD